MVFSQIKAHLRAVSAGTIEEFSTAIGDMCALFKPKERLDAVKAAYMFHTERTALDSEPGVSVLIKPDTLAKQRHYSGNNNAPEKRAQPNDNKQSGPYGPQPCRRT